MMIKKTLLWEEDKMKVVKVTYSEELSSESEILLFQFLKKALLDYVTCNDLKLRALLLGEIRKEDC